MKSAGVQNCRSRKVIMMQTVQSLYLLLFQLLQILPKILLHYQAQPDPVGLNAV